MPEPDPNSETTLDLPGSAAAVDVARHVAAVLARLWGFDEATVDDVRLAVSEIVTAAVLGQPDRVTVTCRGGTSSEMSIEILPVAAPGLIDGPVNRGVLVAALFEGSTLSDGIYRVVVTR